MQVSRAIRGVLGLGLTMSSAFAHEFFSTRITWSREISRLVVKRCAGCHHDGGKAFSLTTFEAARPWAKAIKEEVLNRRMPPWGAVKGFGDFKHDRGLTQEEISLFADWVEGGAPEGEKQYLPKVGSFPAAVEGRAAVAARVAIVNGSLRLRESIRLRAITALAGAPKQSVRVIATRPDGSVEPLIWVLDASAAAKRDFEYRAAVALPAGTVIAADPPVGRWRISFQAGSAKPAPATTKPGS